VRKGTDLSMSGSRSDQRNPVGLLGANVEDGGYPGIPPTSRPRVLFVVVSIEDEGRPCAGPGAARGGDSVSVSVMSVRLGRSPNSEGSEGCPCCNPLRRCNRRAVDDWVGWVTDATFEEGRWTWGVAL
jgi:hypothetical protein